MSSRSLPSPRPRRFRRRDVISTLALLAALAAPILYAGATLVGERLTPDYDHFHQTISEMTTADMPRAAVLNAAFVLYDVLVMALALLLIPALRVGRNRSMLVSAIMLFVSGAAGIAMSTAFPIDPRGAAITTTGAVHIGLAVIGAIASFFAVLFCAAGLWPDRRYTRLSVASFIICAVMAAGAAWSILTFIGPLGYVGLAERVTVGAFLVWLLFVALAVRRRATS